MPDTGNVHDPLTAEQKRALQHARDVLAEESGATQPGLAEAWRRMLRSALTELVAAFGEYTNGDPS